MDFVAFVVGIELGSRAAASAASAIAWVAWAAAPFGPVLASAQAITFALAVAISATASSPFVVLVVIEQLIVAGPSSFTVVAFRVVVAAVRPAVVAPAAGERRRSVAASGPVGVAVGRWLRPAAGGGVEPAVGPCWEAPPRAVAGRHAQLPFFAGMLGSASPAS